MIGQEVNEQKPVTLSEIKELLGKRKKDKELNYEQDVALKYSKKFAKLTPKEAEKLKVELSGISSLNAELVVKITDLLPTRKEVLELLIPKGSGVSDEDLAKVLELTKKYRKE